MDYDVISNLSLNFTFDSNVSPEESMSMIFHEIVFTVICLIGIITDGLIIYIINRFKNMRSKTNIYIMNWLIGDATYLLLTPCFYRILSALENLFIDVEIICISYELASVLQITSILFLIVLCINWYMAVFTVRFGDFHKIVIALVWIMAILGILIFSTYCILQNFFFFLHYLLFFTYAILLCVVISMHITKYFTKHFDIHNKLALNLTLVTTYVICWCPSWICLLLDHIVDSYFVLYILSIGAACLGYLDAPINLYLFARMNKNFRMCLMQVFRCVNHDYSDATHSFEDSDDNFNNVHVSSLNNDSIVDVSDRVCTE